MAFSNDSLFSAAIGLGCGLCIGLLLGGRYVRPMSIAASTSKRPLKKPRTVALRGEYKLVLVVNNDLKMGKGKIAAQCSHASVIAYKQLDDDQPAILAAWNNSGQPKVVVKAEDETAMLQVSQHAHDLGLTVSLVKDAGRTQIAPGSKTVVGIGPGPAHVIDKVTGHLKLL